MVSRATVFGLDVLADTDIPFLSGARAIPTGRVLDVSIVGDTRAGEDDQPRPGDPPRAGDRPQRANWPRAAELICDQREPDGSIAYRIETHRGSGYRLWGPGYGTHLLAEDGRRLTSIPNGTVRDTAWQRLLIAQVLPFAAVLRGLEVFHAGAVMLDGHAVAIAGPSHAGKTSVVLELCRSGASFLSDDVLALERDGETLLGHPGTPLAGLDHGEAARLDASELTSGEEVVAVNERERLVRTSGATQAAPLAALFFLDRRADGPTQPHFEPATDPQLLLTTTFNFVLATPQRLRDLLEVCALAAQLRVERIVIGPSVDASLVAAAVGERSSVRV